MKKSVIVDFSSGTPSSTYSVATGYSVGSEWVNTNNGNRFYHKTDGNWILLDSGGIPETIGTTNSEGIQNAFARQDHIHAHGNQLGGNLHATASTSTAGFMSATDKVILDNFRTSLSGSVLFSNGTAITEDNANLFWDNTNNRLGIGTSTPSKILDVRGDAIINELIIGRGTANIASNTVLGKEALLSNINAPNVVAVGVGALRTNQTGGFTTAVGFNSLFANTTGPNNTAIGADSLKSNQTGVNNTAVGMSSLLTNISGINNTAIGQDSLRLSTGNQNSAVGKDSLRSNTGGGNNTAVGMSSLNSNTSGSNNTAIGVSSLHSNIAGTNNTAIGWESGRFLSNKATPVTALTDSIMIGYRSSPLDNNQNNQIVIGINANGLGSNTTVIGNSSTVTTAIYGNLLLGTTVTSANARLRIDSTTQGVLLPRMTTAQVNAIVAPVQGLIVFNTDLNTLCFYTTSWKQVQNIEMV
jgi:hypothetical protein